MTEPIAVIGMAYRAPKVGREGLWKFLHEGQSAWSTVPADRFDQAAYYHPEPAKNGFFSSKGAHFLPDDIYAFDAAFFNLKADEARSMDPQQRLLLECAFEATESAGLSLKDLAGTRTGVYSAQGSAEYAAQTLEDLPTTSKYTAMGASGCMFANRLSYFFGLEGPSIVLDGACASSAYAVHAACQSLRVGECSAAIVGGASIMVNPMIWVALDGLGALSPDGKSFSYDSKASGFGRGEGAACIILKRLSDALDAKDPIRAIIPHSVCNHGGRSSGITLPSGAAQETLLRRLHAEIGLDPNETPVIEGHGTGTAAGDPIEAVSFARVMANQRSSADPVIIGSLKSNFGHVVPTVCLLDSWTDEFNSHLEGTSGLLAVIKAVMMLEHGIVLPTAHFERMNSNIPQQERERLKVLTKATPWPSGAAKRVCVTNYGFGGSNAAILLQAGPSVAQPQRQISLAYRHDTHSLLSNGHESHVNGHRLINGNGTEQAQDVSNGSTGIHRDQLFVLSAKSSASLDAYLASFQKYLETAPTSHKFVNDLCFTLGQKRTHFPFRLAVTASTVAELEEHLTALPATSAKSNWSREPTIAFAFTGQGAQYPRMGLGLRQYKPFNSAIHDADKVLNRLGSAWSLLEELDKPAAKSRIHETNISQPACTAIQLALVNLLRAWGVNPSVVVGHSSGEIAAAYAAGVHSFETAISIAYFKGLAVPQQSGAMLALGVSTESAAELLSNISHGRAVIAAINSPESVTLSGDELAIEMVQQMAEMRGYFARRLKVRTAYHSHHMQPAAGPLLQSIKPLYTAASKAPPQTHDDTVAFVSSVTGRPKRAGAVDGSYWVENLLQPVRYLDALETILLAEKSQDEMVDWKSPDVIIEIGPHSTLKSPTVQTLQRFQAQHQRQVTYLPSLDRDMEGDLSFLRLAGSLFTMGLDLNFAAVNKTTSENSSVLVDVPAYEWNKVRLLHHPRVAQRKLHHGRYYSSLLGWESPYSEGNERSFRNVFTLDDLPWVRHHKVAGEVLFPFTGYLCLAIEALRAVTSKPMQVVRAREIHVTRGLFPKEDQHIDLTTKLRPSDLGTEAISSSIWTFEILTWSESGGWTSHCRGQIEASPRELGPHSITVQEAARIIETHTRLSDMDVNDEYNAIGENGTWYGPTFKTMTRLRHASGTALHEACLRPMKESSEGTATVDPPTLDGFLHALGIVQDVQGSRAAYVVAYISQLTVSNLIKSTAGTKFSTVTRLVNRDEKAGRLDFRIAAFVGCESPQIPCFELDLTMKRVKSAAAPDDQNALLPSGYTETLVPLVDWMGGDHLATLLRTDDFTVADLQSRRDLDRAGIYYLTSMVNEIGAEVDLTNLPSHLSRFMGWAKKQASRAQGQDIWMHDPAPLLADVANHDAYGKLLCAVGERLVDIVRGRVEPLEIMMHNGLLSRSYEEDLAVVRGSLGLAQYVKSLVNINPRMRILEIGGGTGSATKPILDLIWPERRAEPAFQDYTFTDISSGFFENTRTKLLATQSTDRVLFKRLDITQDPKEQGFLEEEYDLVVASNVLHATPDLGVTMQHVKSLLKPGAKLALLEGMPSDLSIALAFATLPGWWYSSDEYRSDDSPLLTEESWHQVLVANGFSGIDGKMEDFPNSSEVHCTSLLWSTRNVILDERALKGRQPITICGLFSTPGDIRFAELVCERLGSEARLQSIPELEISDQSFYIFLDGSNRSLLQDLSLESFELFKRLVLNPTGLLWITPEASSPESATIKGFLRTLRQEDSTKALLLVEHVPYSTDGVSAVVKAAQFAQSNTSLVRREQDLVWKSGAIHVPRLRAIPDVEETFRIEQGLPPSRRQQIIRQDDSLELTVDATGSFEDFYFRRTDATSRRLDPNDIVVQVDTAGLNFRDLLLILGSLPWHAPGLEGVGTVVRKGSDVHNLKLGDRVFYITAQGGLSTHLHMNANLAALLPPGISITEAASLPMAYSTAITCLERSANLQRGESVLIHAAAGAVGQACIMIATHIGAEIFATAGTPEKREFLHETFGIPLANVFSSRTSDFYDELMCKTNGRGVDVVVNSLSGPLLQASWQLVAEFGRFIEIGKKDASQNSHLGMKPFDRHVSFHSIDLRKIILQKPDVIGQLLSRITSLLGEKAISPIRPATEIPISQLESGLRKLQSGQNIGKIVVTLGVGEAVLTECGSSLEKSSGTSLRQDATYLITGGTGGIGRALACWMIDSGARNVLLFGRSGPSTPEVAALLKRFEGTNIRLHAMACDVSSLEQVNRALKMAEELGMPAVRGVVHGALFLRDSLFANASFQDWRDITAPKIEAAWHLHHLLPDLDFFISLGSVDGVIGHVGQSIYSGTSTFLDAFTEYRRRLGLTATTISLPVVQDIGYVADRGLTESLNSSLGVILSATQVFLLIKAAILNNSTLCPDGKAFVFVPTLRDNAESIESLPWNRFNMLQGANRGVRNDKSSGATNGDPANGKSGKEKNGTADGMATLPDILTLTSEKVASITMMDMEEVTADRNLADYGLDSLIAVELRNWIRREFGVELALNQVVSAHNLNDLAHQVFSRQESG